MIIQDKLRQDPVDGFSANVHHKVGI